MHRRLVCVIFAVHVRNCEPKYINPRARERAQASIQQYFSSHCTHHERVTVLKREQSPGCILPPARLHIAHVDALPSGMGVVVCARARAIHFGNYIRRCFSVVRLREQPRLRFVQKNFRFERARRRDCLRNWLLASLAGSVTGTDAKKETRVNGRRLSRER